MYSQPTQKDYEFMQIAIEEAKQGLNEHGIPIGACLVIDNKVVGRGHNMRVQQNNPVLHGEIQSLISAGRLTADQYKKATIYTTLSPCPMCSGAIRLFKIPRVVIGENVNYLGDEQLLSNQGIELVNLNLPELIEMMRAFIANNPTLWNEDIAE